MLQKIHSLIIIHNLTSDVMKTFLVKHRKYFWHWNAKQTKRYSQVCWGNSRISSFLKCFNIYDISSHWFPLLRGPWFDGEVYIKVWFKFNQDITHIFTTLLNAHIHVCVLIWSYYKEAMMNTAICLERILLPFCQMSTAYASASKTVKSSPSR